MGHYANLFSFDNNEPGDLKISPYAIVRRKQPRSISLAVEDLSIIMLHTLHHD